MSHVLIRKAGSADAHQIARTHIDSWRAAYKDLMPDSILENLDFEARREAWLKIIDQSGWPCLIASNEDKIIGFVHLGASRDPDRDQTAVGEITAIYLEPRHWRQGIGTMLMESAMDILFGRGFSEIDLWVLEGNIAARAFYERLGFFPDGLKKQESRSNTAELRYTRKKAAGAHLGAAT